jgi:Mg/Co/Ni transporter MgtE
MTQAFFEKTVIDKHNYNAFKQLFTKEYRKKIMKIDEEIKKDKEKNLFRTISAEELLSSIN